MKFTLHYLFVLLLAGGLQNAPGKGTIQGIVVKAGSGQPLRGRLNSNAPLGGALLQEALPVRRAPCPGV